jgi:hypothetical protein
VFWQKAWHVHRYIKDQTLYWPKLGSQVLKHKVIYNQNLESRVLNMLILWPRLGKPSLEPCISCPCCMIKTLKVASLGKSSCATNTWTAKPWTIVVYDPNWTNKLWWRTQL